MNEPVRAIVFDAVGTILHPNPPAAEAYLSVGTAFGSRQDLDTIRSRFRAAFERQEELDRGNHWRTNETREVERWRAIVGQVLDDVTKPEKCFEELYEHFSQPDHWRCQPDTAAVLQVLRQRGNEVALASNFDGRLRKVLTGFSFLTDLQHVIISAEIGWRKPAVEFFSAVCGAMAVSPAQVLHFGDDDFNDYEGAVAAGCRAVLFDPAGKAGPEVYAVRKLSDVVDALDRIA
jgi:putative hydrolase of the HAD superfamily